MKNKEQFDFEILLYLSGALVWYKVGALKFLAVFSPSLRGRIQELRKEQMRFESAVKPHLAQKLNLKSEHPQDQRTPFKPAIWAPLVMGLIVLSFLPWQNYVQDPVIAKGAEQGVFLFARDHRALQLREAKQSITPADTLQIVPIGSGGQFLSVYSFDEREGVVKLFPEHRKGSAWVSKDSIPPALLPEKGQKSWLICLSSPISKNEGELLEFIDRELSPQKGLKTGVLYEKNLYAQIYEIEVKHD